MLIEDLAAKPTGRLGHDPSDADYPAQRFLASYAEVLREHLPAEVLARYDRVELVYPLVNDAAGAGPSADAALSDNVRREYATLEPAMPDKLRMVPLASVLLQPVNKSIASD